MKNKIIIIIAIASILFSCRKVLNIDLKDNEKKIVMQSILMPDSIVKVNLSKSLGLLEDFDTIIFLNNAEVKIYEDNVLVENLKYNGFGDYIGTKQLNKNKTYKILAQHPDFKEQAWAEVDFVEQVPINNLSYQAEFQDITQPLYDTMGNYIKDTTYKIISALIIKITIDDPKDIDNFFLLSITQPLPITTFNEQTLKEDTVGYYEEPVSFTIKGIETDPEQNTGLSNTNIIILPTIYLSNKINGKVFSDLWFKNSTYTINAKISVYFDYNKKINDRRFTYQINLYSTPKDVFLFATSLSNYFSAQGSPFSEPVNVYSNVKGGFGFVSSINVSQNSIVIVP